MLRQTQSRRDLVVRQKKTKFYAYTCDTHGHTQCKWRLQQNGSSMIM